MTAMKNRPRTLFCGRGVAERALAYGLHQQLVGDGKSVTYSGLKALPLLTRACPANAVSVLGMTDMTRSTLLALRVPSLHSGHPPAVPSEQAVLT